MPVLSCYVFSVCELLKIVSAPDSSGQVYPVQDRLSEVINLSLFVLCGHMTGFTHAA